MSRSAWADAQGTCADLERELETTEEVMRTSWEDSDPSDLSDLARHHAFVLRQEMARRTQADGVQQQREVVSQKQQVWRQAQKQSQIIETLAEQREEQQRWELAQSQQDALNEVALQGWWRGEG